MDPGRPFSRGQQHHASLRPSPRATWTSLVSNCHAWRKRAASALCQGSGRSLVVSLSSVGMAAAASIPATDTSGPASTSGSDSKAAASRPRSFQDFGHEKRRATDTFLLLNCAAFVLQWLSQDLLTFWGAKVNGLIAAGQWWRLVTPAFLHSSLIHLVVNCHALHSIGPQLELVSGSARLATTYVTAAVTGTFLSYLLTPAPSIGASGALFGCGAALAVFYYRHKDVLQHHSDAMLRNLGITVAINLAYSLLVRNVDNWGHLGGALGGALVAWALGPRRIRGTDGRFYDSPPLPWLAYEAPAKRVGTARAARSAAPPASAVADGAGADGSTQRGRRAPRYATGAITDSAVKQDDASVGVLKDGGMSEREREGKGWWSVFGWGRRPQLQGAASQ